MEENILDQNKEKIPQFLKVLLILSAISIGLAIISSLYSLFIGPGSEENIQKINLQFSKQIDLYKSQNMDYVANMYAQLKRMTIDNFHHFYLATFIKLIWSLLGGFAIFTMFKGKKLGFHLYIIYCLTEVLQLYTFTSPSNIPAAILIYYVIVSGAFIFMYSRNLKWMEN